MTGLILGFGSYVIYAVQSESAALLDQYRKNSRLFAEGIKSGIRHMMLSGRPSYVRSLIEEAREEFRGTGRLRLFDNEANEIFAERERFISRPAGDSLVSALVVERDDMPRIPRPYTRLENEKACQVCHGTDHTVRGLIELELEYTGQESLLLAGHVAVQAFKSIMLSGKGDTAGELLKAIEPEGGSVGVQVYDRDGYYVAFGDDSYELPGEILEEASAAFKKEPQSGSVRNTVWHEKPVFIFPLDNDERCQVCHGPDHSLRGMFVIWGRKPLGPADPYPEKVAVSGFKNMMLMQRGMYAADYIERVRALPFVKAFRVFDNGRRHSGDVREHYVPNPRFIDPDRDPMVEELILRANGEPDAGGIRTEFQETLNDGAPYLTQIIPLMNDEKCQACHQPVEMDDPRYERYKDRWKVRSAVKVSISMEPIIVAIRRNLFASVGTGILTIFLVAVVLRFFMRRVVLDPLGVIGGAARQVGEGNLATQADVTSKDEIGALAEQINRMIQGLRERLHLTRFVSLQTVEAVKTAEPEGVGLGGVRKEAAVLFSDIRGFTSFSEKVEPERVVEMLNIYLNEQAQLVKRFNGDIDKFVGDELMAVFLGDTMIEDAIRCGIALQERIAGLNEEYHVPMKVGIGINAGPVVMGAMGSVDRMDFTVLGDSVNVASRLCGAAGPGEILVSTGMVALLPEAHGISFKHRDPVSAKGKSKPIPVSEVIPTFSRGSK